MTFDKLPIGAKFTTELFHSQVKVWEKTGPSSCKGLTARGKSIRQLLFNVTFEVKETK